MTSGNYLYRLRCGDRAVDLQADATTGGWILASGLGGLQAGQLSVQYEAGSGQLPSLQRLGSTRGPASITFQTHLVNTVNIGGFLRNMRDVERFVGDVWLHHEEGARAPIYLERRLNEGYSGTGDEVVLFGRGATYYRVLSIDSISFPEASNATIAVGWIPNASFTLICDPYPVGKPQICGTGFGWLRFDDDSNINIWDSGTNLIHNPSFEHATPGTDWTVEDADLSAAVEYHRVRTGWQSMRLTNKHASDAHKYTVTLTLSDNSYALSAYVYTTGAAVTSADVVLYGQGAALATTFEADADHPGWYRAKAIFNALAASSTHGLQVKALHVVYVDDVQLEVLPVASYAGTNLYTNPGFETAGAGGADVFDDWTEIATDGAIARTTTAGEFRSGAAARKLTAGAGVSTKVTKTVTVTAGTTYLLRFYTRGDGTNAGRFALYDGSNAADIIALRSTGVTSASFNLCSYYFTAPAGCALVQITLQCPAGDTQWACFDDTSLVALSSANIYPWSPFMLDGYDPGPGVVWAGTAHDSNQTRTGGEWRLFAPWIGLRGTLPVDYGKGTLCMWVKTPWAGPDCMTHYLYSDSNIVMWKSNDNTLYLRFYGAGTSDTKELSIATDTSNWPANTWLCVIATWLAGAPTGLYLYGGTAASDTSVTTAGDYVPCSNNSSNYFDLGNTGSLSTLQGWFGDVRIFGKDATVTPATLYAAGRGKSELPFLWVASIVADTYRGNHSAEDYPNYGFIANLPGDVPAPCRLIVNNTAPANDYIRAYYGIRINGNLTTNLNCVEGVAGTDATDAADTDRSADSRTRVAPAATTEPAAFNVRFTVLADGRKTSLVYGRYKIVAVVGDRHDSTGLFKARLKTYLNTTGLMETGDWVSANRVDAAEYVLLDMGTFTIPPLDPPQAFLGQEITQTGDRTAYCNVDMFVWMTSGSGKNFDVDHIILLPERINGFIYDSANNWVHSNSVAIDAISTPPRTYMTEVSSVGGIYPEDITLDPFARVDVQGDWPVLPPQTWCFVNQIVESNASGVDVDDTTMWLVQYQPVYMWGR